MSEPMAELNDRRQLIYSSLLLDSTGGRALLDPQTHASTNQCASRHTVFRHTLRTCFLPA
jgi:hypothetical protein